MKKILILTVLFCFFYSFSFADIQKRHVEDNIGRGLEMLKKIIESKEWVPVDSANYFRLLELIAYIESSPIDSVITGLKKDWFEKEIFFVRDYQRIKNPEQVSGYVQQSEIALRLTEIEAYIQEMKPHNAILVPEEIFTGGYAQLNLIGVKELERVINEGIADLSIDIYELLTDPSYAENDSVRNVADSLKMGFLEKSRLEHNQRLIQKYRDSVANEYRKKFIANLVEESQQHYLDSVMKINTAILNRHNDSETLRMNKELKQELKLLITYLSRTPNHVNIYNLNNDHSQISLQNDGIWAKWIWLKNSQNDSIGIRIENLDRQSMRILVDESVNLSRLSAKDALEVDRLRPTNKQDLKLAKVVIRSPELSPWKLIGKAYTGFTQTYINPYWSKGGNSTASALTTFNYTADYKKDKLRWENFFDLKVGLIYYLSEETEAAPRNWHKNSDSFELNSRLVYSAFKKWYYGAEANFKTQLFQGYKNNKEVVPTSAFFSPAYLTFSAGLEYKPRKELAVFLSPVSLKTTYVTNPLVNVKLFGLAEGETYRSRFGLSGKFDYSKSLFENVSLKTKNSIFINYGSSSTGEWQFLKIPDFESETAIDFKVNHFITTQLNFHLIYDKDIESSWTNAAGVAEKGTRLQIKEFFTLGISYRF
jgi:hypothetical protein